MILEIFKKVFVNMKEILYLPRDLKLIFFAHMLWEVGSGFYLFVFPLFIRDLGGRPEDIGFLYSLMYFVVTLATLIGGFLADRFDRKKLILQMWIFGSIAILLYSFATEWLHLAPAIILYSLIIGGPAEDAYITTSASEETMAKAFTYTEIGYSLGMIFSPLLGAYLFPFLGIRGLLRLAFVVCATSITPLLLISSQFPKEKKSYGIKKSLKDFLIPFKNKQLMLWIPFFMLIVFANTMIIPFISPLLEDIYGFDRSLILAMSSALSAGEVLFGVFLGWIGDKWTTGKILSLALVVLSLNVLVLTLKIPLFILPLVIFITGIWRGAIALTRSIVGLHAGSSPGITFAVYSILLSVPQILAPKISGILYEKSPIQPFLIGSILLLALAPVIIIKERHNTYT